jgi:putative DNA primase/helicase
MTDLRTLARALGGDVVGRDQLAFPGPGHSRQDRSATLWLVPDAPDGFRVHSHAGDDPLALRDHVRFALGLPGWHPDQKAKTGAPITPPTPQDDAERTAKALRIFNEAQADHPALQAYLTARGVELPPGALGDTVRFHPRCPWGPGQTVPAMLCLVREINGTADDPAGPARAIHRTRLLDDDGKLLLHGKDRKRALGPIGGGVIKLTRDEDVTACLGVGEGIESALSLRNRPEFGPSPVWATINASGLENFPVLSGIEALHIAVDRDESGRGQQAAETLAERWAAAGRDVFLVEPTEVGRDLNDIDARGGQS